MKSIVKVLNQKVANWPKQCSC